MNKLGFGFLRLPKAGEEVDWNELCRMVDLFLEGGEQLLVAGTLAFQQGDHAISIALIEIRLK